jgi:hypothetical protein
VRKTLPVEISAETIDAPDDGEQTAVAEAPPKMNLSAGDRKENDTSAQME